MFSKLISAMISPSRMPIQSVLSNQIYVIGVVSCSLGWFPSNYVQEETSRDQQSHSKGASKSQPFRQDSKSGSTPPPPPLPQPVLDVVIALYTFNSQNEEELSFHEGERLEVIARPQNDPDWWMARNQLGHTGLIPKNYVQVIEEEIQGDSPQMANRTSGRTNTCSSPSMRGKQKQRSEKADLISRVWYYGNISRGFCDQMLNEFGEDGDFLIRDSETNVSDMKLIERLSLTHMFVIAK